jgi:membrane protein
MEEKIKRKSEANIIIVIDALKKIMTIFLGPFLTAYFIKTSNESMVDLSIYYIFSYLLLGIGSFIVASIVKNKFRIGMFRLGVVFNFIYIMTIVLLREKIVDNLWLISILYGISQSAYWFPYNLFVIDKIENSERTNYTVKKNLIVSSIGVLFPIILGTTITITNFELTSIIILAISLVQIILSFMLTPDKHVSQLNKYNMVETWNRIKKNKQVKKMLLVEFLVGFTISDGALGTLITILIFNAFKTNMNLGIITSISTILSMCAIKLYGKIFKNKSDKKILMFSSIIPVISVLTVLFNTNNITIIIYCLCYEIFVSGILSLNRSIRLFNISDSKIINKEDQSEFFSIREGILNVGRMVSYSFLLLAGISGNVKMLNIALIILTISILIMGFILKDIEKFEE